MKSRHACTILLLMSIPVMSAVATETIRFATFNTSLNRNKAGALQEELEGGNSDQARKIAQILQRVRPDVLLLNEVDYDSSGKTVQLFRQHYLEVSQGNQPPLHYQHTRAFVTSFRHDLCAIFVT